MRHNELPCIYCESSLSLDQFGFAVTTTSYAKSSHATTVSSSSASLPLAKRRRFNLAWTDKHEWLKCDEDNGVVFSDWCCHWEHTNEAKKQQKAQAVEAAQRHNASASCIKVPSFLLIATSEHFYRLLKLLILNGKYYCYHRWLEQLEKNQMKTS